MKNRLLQIALVLSLFCFTQCESQLPDLTFQDWEYIQNPCNGSIEYLDVRNFYEFSTPNGFRIWLYYRPNQNAFFDCNGIPWNIWPPFRIYSPRYAINRGAIGKKTETAKAPSVRAYTRVVDSAGNTVDTSSNIMTINDLTPDNAILFESEIYVNYDNSLYVSTLDIDPSSQVDERDESNNQQGGSFERSASNSGNYFRINAAKTEQELNSQKIRHMRYKNGKVEVVN